MKWNQNQMYTDMFVGNPSFHERMNVLLISQLSFTGTTSIFSATQGQFKNSNPFLLCFKLTVLIKPVGSKLPYQCDILMALCHCANLTVQTWYQFSSEHITVGWDFISSWLRLSSNNNNKYKKQIMCGTSVDKEYALTGSKDAYAHWHTFTEPYGP